MEIEHLARRLDEPLIGRIVVIVSRIFQIQDIVADLPQRLLIFLFWFSQQIQFSPEESSRSSWSSSFRSIRIEWYFESVSRRSFSHSRRTFASARVPAYFAVIMAASDEVRAASAEVFAMAACFEAILYESNGPTRPMMSGHARRETGQGSLGAPQPQACGPSQRVLHRRLTGILGPPIVPPAPLAPQENAWAARTLRGSNLDD
jgi:hypothetical protein